MHFDKVEVPIPCPKCRNKFKLCIGYIKNSPNATCPHCKHLVEINGSELNASTYWVKQSLKDITGEPEGGANSDNT